MKEKGLKLAKNIKETKSPQYMLTTNRPADKKRMAKTYRSPLQTQQHGGSKTSDLAKSMRMASTLPYPLTVKER